MHDGLVVAAPRGEATKLLQAQHMEWNTIYISGEQQNLTVVLGVCSYAAITFAVE